MVLGTFLSYTRTDCIKGIQLMDEKARAGVAHLVEIEVHSQSAIDKREKKRCKLGMPFEAECSSSHRQELQTFVPMQCRSLAKLTKDMSILGASNRFLHKNACIAVALFCDCLSSKLPIR
jgi:hypothetical protein